MDEIDNGFALQEQKIKKEYNNFTLNNNLNDLIEIKPAKPVKVLDSSTSACQTILSNNVVKDAASLVTKLFSIQKVRTIADIRKEYEAANPIGDYLSNVEQKIVNLFSKKISKFPKYIDEETILNNKEPVSRAAWVLLNEISQQYKSQYLNVGDSRYRLVGSKNKVKKVHYLKDISRKQNVADLEKKPNFELYSPRRGLLKNSLKVSFKPGPRSKKPYLDNSYQKYNIGKTLLVKMPIVGIEVLPEIGKQLAKGSCEYLSTYMEDVGCIDKKWADFALSALVSDQNTKSHVFPLNYEKKRNMLLVRQDDEMSLVINDTTSECIDAKKQFLDMDEPNLGYLNNYLPNNEIETDIKSIISDLLRTVCISHVQDHLYENDSEFNSENKTDVSPTNFSNNNAVEKKSKKKSRLSELKKLGMTVIDVNDTGEHVCIPQCQLGCVHLNEKCFVSVHCRHVECMFDDYCILNNENTDNIKIPLEAANLQFQATKYLAKEELKFHQTVILSNNETIVMGAEKRDVRYKRPSTSTLNENKKKMKLIVSLNRLPDLGSVEIWCMVHQLYRCFCKGNFLSGSAFNLSVNNIKSEQLDHIWFEKNIAVNENRPNLIHIKPLKTAMKTVKKREKEINNKNEELVNDKNENQICRNEDEISNKKEKEIINNNDKKNNKNANQTLMTPGQRLMKKIKKIKMKRIIASKMPVLRSVNDKNYMIVQSKKRKRNRQRLLGKKENDLTNLSSPFWQNDSEPQLQIPIDYEEKIDSFEMNVEKKLNKELWIASTLKSSNNCVEVKCSSKNNDLPKLLNDQIVEIKRLMDSGEDIISLLYQPRALMLFPLTELLTLYENGKCFFHLSTQDPYKLCFSLEQMCIINFVDVKSLPLADIDKYPPIVKVILYKLEHFDTLLVLTFKHRFKVFQIVGQINKQERLVSHQDVYKDEELSTESLDSDSIKNTSEVNEETRSNVNSTSISQNLTTIKIRSVDEVNKSAAPNENPPSLLLSALRLDVPRCSNEEEKDFQTIKLPISGEINLSNFSTNINDLQRPPQKTIRYALPTSNNCKWFKMTIENDFVEMQVPSKGYFSVKYDYIDKAIQFANAHNKTIRFIYHDSGDTDSSFGMYAVPRVDGRCIFIGPYKPDEQPGIKTISKKGSPVQEKRTRGVWLYPRRIESHLDSDQVKQKQQIISTEILQSAVVSNKVVQNEPTEFVKPHIIYNYPPMNSTAMPVPKLKLISKEPNRSMPLGNLIKLNDVLARGDMRTLPPNVSLFPSSTKNLLQSSIEETAKKPCPKIKVKKMVTLFQRGTSILKPLKAGSVVNTDPSKITIKINRKQVLQCLQKKPNSEKSSNEKMLISNKTSPALLSDLNTIVVDSSDDEEQSASRKIQTEVGIKTVEVKKNDERESNTIKVENLPSNVNKQEFTLGVVEKLEKQSPDRTVIGKQSTETEKNNDNKWEENENNVYLVSDRVKDLGYLEAIYFSDLKLIHFSFPGSNSIHILPEKNLCDELNRLLSARIKFLPKELELKWQIIRSPDIIALWNKMRPEHIDGNHVLSNSGLHMRAIKDRTEDLKVAFHRLGNLLRPECGKIKEKWVLMNMTIVEVNDLKEKEKLINEEKMHLTKKLEENKNILNDLIKKVTLLENKSKHRKFLKQFQSDKS